VTWAARSSSKPASTASSSDLGLVDPDVPQGVGHGAGRLGDDERIPGVSLRTSRVQIGDPAHRQPGQIGDFHAFDCFGDGHGQGTDGGRLIHDHQYQPVGCDQLLKDRAQPRLVVGQGLVEDHLPGRGHGHGVVVGLADVETDEHRR